MLRYGDNNKWYGVVLEVSADKLGLSEAMCLLFACMYFASSGRTIDKQLSSQ